MTNETLSEIENEFFSESGIESSSDINFIVKVARSNFSDKRPYKKILDEAHRLLLVIPNYWEVDPEKISLAKIDIPNPDKENIKILIEMGLKVLEISKMSGISRYKIEKLISDDYNKSNDDFNKSNKENDFLHLTSIKKNLPAL